MKKLTGFLIFLMIFGNVFFKNHNAIAAISDEQAHEIVLNGTPDDVKKLLQSGYDVNKVYLCNTLLNTAIKSLVQSETGINQPDKTLEKIKILVNAGADVNKSGCSGKVFTPLSWAVSLPLQMQQNEYKTYKAIKQKIKDGKEYCDWTGIISKPCKDITKDEYKNIKKFFQEAYENGYIIIEPYVMEITRFLVENGADINGKDIQDQTPLHHASGIPQSISTKLVTYLIEKGANINAVDIYNQTPLFFAYGAGNNQIVNILIKAGANQNIKNNKGITYSQAKAIIRTDTLQEDGSTVYQYRF